MGTPNKNASNHRQGRRSAFTLIELSLVVALLAVMAALAVIKYGNAAKSARITAAEHDLAILRAALIGGDTANGYLADMSPLRGFTPAYIRVHSLLNPTNVIAVSTADNGARTYRHLDPHFAKGAALAAPPRCDTFAFTNYDAAAERGWNGPYVRLGGAVQNTAAEYAGLFPRPSDRRKNGDRTFEARGFFPRAGQALHDFTDPDELRIYGIPGEQAIADPWGNPYVLQIPPDEAFDKAALPLASRHRQNELARFRFARVVSAGPNGILETPCFDPAPTGLRDSDDSSGHRSMRLAGRLADGTAAARGDDIVLFVNREDTYEEGF